MDAGLLARDARKHLRPPLARAHGNVVLERRPCHLEIVRGSAGRLRAVRGGKQEKLAIAVTVPDKAPPVVPAGSQQVRVCHEMLPERRQEQRPPWWLLVRVRFHLPCFSFTVTVNPLIKFVVQEVRGAVIKFVARSSR